MGPPLMGPPEPRWLNDFALGSLQSEHFTGTAARNNTTFQFRPLPSLNVLLWQITGLTRLSIICAWVFWCLSVCL